MVVDKVIVEVETTIEEVVRAAAVEVAVSTAAHGLVTPVGPR